MTETAQKERKYEFRELPAEKPILFRVDAVLEAKPVVNPHSGKKTQMVNWLLRVDDRKYPQFNDQAVFHRTNAWCAAGSDGKRATGSYQFIETLRCNVAFWDGVDLLHLMQDSPDELKSFVGMHVVGWMKPVEEGTDGRRWQNPKEFKHPDELEWVIADRRMDRETMRQYIGQPKSKQTAAPIEPPAPLQPPQPPADPPTEQAPAKQEPPRTTAKEPPVAEIDAKIQAEMGAHKDLKNFFVRMNGADRISALPEEKRRHLWVLFQIESLEHDSDPWRCQNARDCIGQHLVLRDAARYEDLDYRDACLLLSTIEANLASVDDVPF